MIRSELAAKPIAQRSRVLVNLIRRIGTSKSALDYGCGRLRYSGVLKSVSQSLALVDSSAQLARHVTIGGTLSSISDHATKRWPDVRLESAEAFEARLRPRFDFALIANVLSAIPSRRIALRMLRAVARRMKRNGIVLVVNQHTNSHYLSRRRRGRVRRHGDGWLNIRKRGATYFGLLDVDKVRALLAQAGYVIRRQWVVGQSNYCLAGVS
jgi:hypothetical protein